MSGLDNLLKKQEQLAARIQALQAKEVTQQRKDETRRKILIGAYVLDKYEKLDSYEKLIEELDVFLFKKQDRSLFGLAAREEKAVV